MSQHTSHPMSRGAVIFGFVTVIAIWGSTFLVIRDQVSAHNSALTAEWTVTLRFVIAALGMGAFIVARGESLLISREGMKIAALVGATQFCGNYIFVYHAEHYIASGLVAVIFALLMVPNALLSHLLLGTPLRPRFLAGAGVAIVGIAMLMAHEYGGGGAYALLGVGLTLGALVCASLANVAQATAAGRSQPMLALVGWSMAVGAVIDGVLALAVGGLPVLEASPRFWIGLIYLAIAGSVVTFPLYFALIRNLGAGRAAFSQVAIPVVAMGLSTLFEGYRWTGLAVGGSLLAMAGLVIALTGKRD